MAMSSLFPKIFTRNSWLGCLGFCQSFLIHSVTFWQSGPWTWQHATLPREGVSCVGRYLLAATLVAALSDDSHQSVADPSRYAQHDFTEPKSSVDSVCKQAATSRIRGLDRTYWPYSEPFCVCRSPMMSHGVDWKSFISQDPLAV